MANLEEMKHKLATLKELQLEDKERHHTLMIKDVDNYINNVNIQNAKAVHDQVILIEDKMRIRAKHITYLKQYITKHEADSTSIVEEDISISKLAVVSQSLPVFCEGNEDNKNVIRDIEEFADRFERVLRAHNLDLDNN